MHLRELHREELDQLLELYTHLHKEDEALPDQATLMSVWSEIQKNNNIFYFGVFVENNLVSSCTLTIIPNLTRSCRPYGVIENVVTHKDYRHNGYGRSVLEKSLKHAWSKNCYKVMLLTGRLNEETYSFYESAGFDRSSKQGFVAKPKIT